MSYLLPNYGRQSIEFTRGLGSYVWDTEGKKYLDFTSGIGVQNLGHRPPLIEAALKRQLETLWHTPNLYLNSKQEKVGKLLGDGYDYLAYFCNSGAEANEAALKLARKATGREKIISFKDSFHGRTFGAMTATGQESIQAGFGSLVPHFSYLTYNYLPDLEQLDETVAAVILELVQGEGGVLPAEKVWIKALSAICHEKGILVIVDEVQTGMGRTGTFYAFEQYPLLPDIVTLAKGLGNGVPVGAMLSKKQYASSFGPGSHGSTFGGNLLGMTAAEKVIEGLQEEGFLEDVQNKSAKCFEQLEALKTLEIVKEVRGKGLMIGIQVPQHKVQGIMTACLEKNLLVLRAGKDVIRLLPPLTITTEELNTGITIIKDVLEAQDD